MFFFTTSKIVETMHVLPSPLVLPTTKKVPSRKKGMDVGGRGTSRGGCLPEFGKKTRRRKERKGGRRWHACVGLYMWAIDKGRPPIEVTHAPHPTPPPPPHTQTHSFNVYKFRHLKIWMDLLWPLDYKDM